MFLISGFSGATATLLYPTGLFPQWEFGVRLLAIGLILLVLREARFSRPGPSLRRPYVLLNQDRVRVVYPGVLFEPVEIHRRDLGGIKVGVLRQPGLVQLAPYPQLPNVAILSREAFALPTTGRIRVPAPWGRQPGLPLPVPGKKYRGFAVRLRPADLVTLTDWLESDSAQGSE